MFNNDNYDESFSAAKRPKFLVKSEPFEIIPFYTSFDGGVADLDYPANLMQFFHENSMIGVIEFNKTLPTLTALYHQSVHFRFKFQKLFSIHLHGSDRSSPLAAGYDSFDQSKLIQFCGLSRNNFCFPALFFRSRHLKKIFALKEEDLSVHAKFSFGDKLPVNNIQEITKKFQLLKKIIVSEQYTKLGAIPNDLVPSTENQEVQVVFLQHAEDTSYNEAVTFSKVCGGENHIVVFISSYGCCVLTNNFEPGIYLSDKKWQGPNMISAYKSGAWGIITNDSYIVLYIGEPKFNLIPFNDKAIGLDGIHKENGIIDSLNILKIANSNLRKIK